MPADDDGDVTGDITAATHNLVGACASHGIERLVVSTMAGIEDPVFDGLAYCTGKRAAERIVLDSPVSTTIIKSPLWHECATNPAAVVFNDHEVLVEDWLIQPIAADTVADVLVEAALSQTRVPRTITGPQRVRLPELVAKLLARRGDGRRIRTVAPALTALAHGALLARDHAVALGPDVDTWLQTLAPAGADISPPGDGGELQDGPMA
jgi:dTDP-4-dehydrorhamnose reductase